MKLNSKVILVAGGLLLVLICGFLILKQDAVPSSESPAVVVYKRATCGCCAKWVAHMEDAGFEVEAHDVTNLGEIKDQHGVTQGMASCHTAIVDGYVVEGHVPAVYVQKLLEERPDIEGIAVPGMPIGSPGMEGPNAKPYDVLAFDDQGQVSVFARVVPR